jgi:hypothetical protein
MNSFKKNSRFTHFIKISVNCTVLPHLVDTQSIYGVDYSLTLKNHVFNLIV